MRTSNKNSLPGPTFQTRRAIRVLLTRLLLALPLMSLATRAACEEKLPRVAAIVTSYYHNSHADVLVSRLFEGHLLNGTGRFPKLKLASLYTDQVQTDPRYRDVSRAMAAKYKFPIFDTVAGALTLGTDKLAVDGVLLIAEHGAYPLSPRGQILYPKRRLFDDIVAVFRQSERTVPVFFDKHLADNWSDAEHVYRTAQEMNFPLLAGSCLPLTWRYPPLDLPRGEKLKEIVITSFGPIEGYTFHALESAQALAERRAGGETGIASVECFRRDQVWEAGRRGLFDKKLLDAALARLKTHPLPKGTVLEQRIKEPVLIHVRHLDGLIVNVLVLDFPVVEWAVAWRTATDQVQATVYWTQEERPLMQFGFLLDRVEELIHTGKPAWPIERTLLTTGVLGAMFDSLQKGRAIQTPELAIKYFSDFDFEQPPPPPPGRPLTGQ